MKTTTIYRDTQDPNNTGWAYRVCDEEREHEESGPLDTLDDLLYALRGSELSDDSDVDMTNLPTFGGDEPGDTMGVWSWDEGRLLVGDGSYDMQIVSRDYWYL